MKKISIITPNLNCGQYLREALESVFSQGHLSVEHIVLDGGSTDESIAVLKAWEREVGGQRSEVGSQGSEVGDQRSGAGGQVTSADGRYVFKWISEKDAGQSDAINKGFRMATGDIRTWLNADEFYYPGTFHAITERFSEQPTMGVLYGEALWTRKDGSPLRIRHAHRPDQNVLLYYGCYIASVAAFYNGRIFDDGVFLDETYRVTMDFEFYARLWDLGYTFAYIPRIIGAFRLTGDNVCIRLSDVRRKERLQVQKKYGFPRKMDWGLPAVILDTLAFIHRIKSHLLKFMRQMGKVPEKTT